MSAKNEIYTCVGFLLLVLGVGLYIVWVIYGFGPFVIGGIVVGGFAIYIVYNSRKAKHAKTGATSSENSQETLSKLAGATPEEREKMLEARGFTKYTDENGNTRWKMPEQLQELAKAEKVDIVFKKDSMEMMIEKQRPQIRCSYCGTLYDETLSRCPNCGAIRDDESQRNTTGTA